MIGKELPVSIRDGAQFDYVNPANPTISVNPMKSWATWLNVTTGELFICVVNTTDNNEWSGQHGTYTIREPTSPYFIQGEYDGSKVLDISGNGRDIAVSGGYNYGYKDLHAVHLDGANNTTGMGSVDFLDVSISFWFRSENTALKRWLSIGTWANSGTLLFYNVDYGMKGCVALPNDAAQIGSGSALPLTGLQHICLIRDSGNSKSKMYCNGSFVAEDTDPDSTTHIAGPLTIGDSADSAKGVVADLRIYDRVLTDDEILALYKLHKKYAEN
jgi:hypothetical protein